jgi:homoserine dehydrogenase
VKPEQVHVEGVTHLTQADLKFARSMGYAIKLLGVIRLDPTNHIEVRVQPCLIPQNNIMANVHGVMNAVAVYGDIVGETLFYGSGAGQNATSSSVISDLADAVDNFTNEAGTNNGFVPQGHYGACLPVDDTVSRYYLRLRVDDRPGVIASISGIIAGHGIGILSLQQPEVDPGSDADLMLMLHTATFGQMKRAVAAIAGLECVIHEPVLLRVESLRARD